MGPMDSADRLVRAAEAEPEAEAGRAAGPEAEPEVERAAARLRSASPTLTVIDDYPPRVRSAADGIRVLAAALGVLVLGAIGIWADQTADGLNADLVQAVDTLPTPLTDSLQFLSGLSALAGVGTAIIVLLVRNRFRQLVEGVLVAAITVGVCVLLDWAVDAGTDTALYHSLTLATRAGTSQPLDAFLAAWVALLVGSAVAVRRLTRGVLVAAIVVYLISALGSAHSSALSLAVSAAVGATVALAVRHLIGAVNERTSADEIVRTLNGHGLGIVAMERIAPASARRSYHASTLDGRAYYLEVLDRESVATGWLYRAYRLIRLSAELTAGLALSIDRAAERRILLGLAAQAAGARVPKLVGGYACGERTNVLAYEHVTGTPLADLGRPPTDAEIADLWRNSELLHDAGVSHPRLTPNRVRIDGHGAIVLPILEDGRVVSGSVRLDIDRAQTLIATALLVGPEHAMRLARRVLSEDELTGVLAVLQPIALTREVRRSLREHKSLLDELRTAWSGAEELPVPAMPRLERVRPRTVIALVGLIIAAWLLIGQLGSVDLATVLRRAGWQWVPLLFAASALSYVAAALSVIGLVREKLSLLRTTLVQVAASFVGFVLPPALGPLAINIRFLQRVGLSTPAAATTVGASQLVNGAVHALLLAGVAAATGQQPGHTPDVPLWAWLVLAALVLAALVALVFPQVRRWLALHLQSIVRDVGPRLVELVNRPVKLAQVVGGALLLSGANIAALWFAVRAFHGPAAILTIAVIYLAGAAVGSLAPTPGGMGAIEVAMSTGLATAGMPSAAAVSAVLLYRIGTFWLPVPAGWVALTQLQKRSVL